MPSSKGNQLFDTFVESSKVLLFGTPFFGLKLESNPAAAEDGGAAPGRVDDSSAQAEHPGTFARIYGFSFEGHYYKLPRPVLFLVDDDGGSRSPGDTVVDGAPGFSTGLTGVEAKDWQFGREIRVWAVNKYDIAVRLDLEIGSYDDVLLQPLSTRQEESGFRGKVTSRSYTDFRGKMLDAHQDR